VVIDEQDTQCGYGKMTSNADMKLAEREYRVFGPPGTGKTRWIMNSIKSAREKYDGYDIFITSFTKAAAQEIVYRVSMDSKQNKSGGSLLPESSIGTLHAHCYRAIGNVELAEKHTEEFSKEFPSMALVASSDLDDPYQLESGKAQGVADYQEMNRLRGMMIPMEEWPLHIQMLNDAWTEWKDSNGLMDFTDLLETALYNFDTAPNDPRVGFVDEAQDLTPLQFALIRKWARHMDRVVIVGDEDQCLYSFIGASPDSMLYPVLPQENLRTLTNTYRLPRAIVEWSQNLITKVERRYPKDIVARTEGGEVRYGNASTKDPWPLLQMLEEDEAKGRSSMILASCSYMLNPIIQMLRESGVAFHNPYRKTHGSWNPLRVSSKAGGTAVDSVLAFFESADNNTWVVEDVRKWTKFVKADAGFIRGSKKRLKEEDYVDPSEIFNSNVAMMFGMGTSDEKLRWFMQNLTSEGRRRLDFPLSIALKNRANLGKTPRITIGTIHSVKGGEADSVYVFPDMSPQQWREYNDTGLDTLRRLYYVAGTRAKETLTLCSPSYGVPAFPLYN
jgi:DNA helicase-2/ATP-dependent DNA helicase PcrA